MVIYQRKSHQRAAALSLVDSRCSSLVVAQDAAPSSSAALPPLEGSSLDPASGDLDAARAARKRQQISSLAAHALAVVDEIGAGARVVEFGAGSGHLGLLVAHVRPDCVVTLVELKAHSCAVARERAASLPNVSIFEGSVDDFAATDEPFDCALGLHLCGLLTDSVAALVVRRRARAAIVPCCYGQLAGIEDHRRGGGIAPSGRARSDAFAAALGDGDAADAWASVCRSADGVATSKGGGFDVADPSFASAARAMALVDSDRCHWLRQAGYRAALSRLEPPTCSPKASVLLLRPPSEG